MRHARRRGLAQRAGRRPGPAAAVGRQHRVPKLIPRTADDHLYSVRESARICGLGPQTVALGVLPATHNFALSSPGLLGVLHAGHMVMAPSGDPGTAFARVQAEGVNWCALVPSLVPVWLQAARDPAMAAQLETLAVVQVGGAKLDADMAARLESGLGVSVQQVFGMAEGLVCFGTRWDDSPALRLGTQGRPISPDDECGWWMSMTARCQTARPATC